MQLPPILIVKSFVIISKTDPDVIGVCCANRCCCCCCTGRLRLILAGGGGRKWSNCPEKTKIKHISMRSTIRTKTKEVDWTFKTDNNTKILFRSKKKPGYRKAS